jgi:hypothetical protein
MHMKKEEDRATSEKQSKQAWRKDVKDAQADHQDPAQWTCV